jgi:hypothetical protein
MIYRRQRPMEGMHQPNTPWDEPSTSERRNGSNALNPDGR